MTFFDPVCCRSVDGSVGLAPCDNTRIEIDKSTLADYKERLDAGPYIVYVYSDKIVTSLYRFKHNILGRTQSLRELYLVLRDPGRDDDTDKLS